MSLTTGMYMGLEVYGICWKSAQNSYLTKVALSFCLWRHFIYEAFWKCGVYTAHLEKTAISFFKYK